MKNLGKSISPDISSNILGTYNDASKYTKFDGTTSQGAEGTWIGYKGGSSGCGIYISNGFGIVQFKINSSGTISFKTILA